MIKKLTLFIMILNLIVVLFLIDINITLFVVGLLTIMAIGYFAINHPALRK